MMRGDLDLRPTDVARGCPNQVNEACRIERAQHLQAMPYERSAQRQVNPKARPGV